MSADLDWIAVLRAQAIRHGQRTIADALGYSTTVISQVLQGSYAARLDRIEAAVRGKYMAATVRCPVLQEISTALCMQKQSQRFSIANPQRVKLWKACPSCPHYKGTRRAEGDANGGGDV